MEKRNEFAYKGKQERAFKKDLKPLLKELGDKIVPPQMVAMMFKGPGGRCVTAEEPEIKKTCNHPPVPLSMGAMASEASIVWFFKQHKDDLSACYCFLDWLERMTTQFPEANDKFLLGRWSRVEKVWASLS